MTTQGHSRGFTSYSIDHTHYTPTWSSPAGWVYDRTILLVNWLASCLSAHTFRQTDRQTDTFTHTHINTVTTLSLSHSYLWLQIGQEVAAEQTEALGGQQVRVQVEAVPGLRGGRISDHSQSSSAIETNRLTDRLTFCILQTTPS